MKLSKVIPKRTKTVKVLWCQKDFMVMSDKYREIRSILKDPKDTCFWCRHKFRNGEMMALASIEEQFNKILCHTCADDVLKSADDS